MMLICQVGALLLAARAASCFKDSSPFFLLSTEPLKPNTLQSAQLSTAATVEHDVLAGFADGAPAATTYILVHQPGLSAADLRDGSSMPKMRRRIEDPVYKSVVQIPEVVGNIDSARLARSLGVESGLPVMRMTDYLLDLDARGKPAVLTLDFPPMDPDARAKLVTLEDEDWLLDGELESNFANTSHVVIFTSSASSVELEQQQYEMDDGSSQYPHAELRRDIGGLAAPRKRQSQSQNPQDGLPLFEKYQFLTPAIFMGLLVSLLLFLIAYVGVSAVAGLEVSYMAFSKEMGPAAQQKGKQS